MRQAALLAITLTIPFLINCGGGSSGNAADENSVPIPTYTSFVESGAMSTNRTAFSATLLNDGRVLILGGYDTSSELDSGEIFNPSADGGKGAFSLLSSHMTVTRYRHTSTLLSDGTVLITGGRDSSFNSRQTAELFIPSANGGQGGFQLLSAKMNVPRADHVATLLADGRVLITGGVSGSVLNSAEVYNPTTKIFSATDPMVSVRIHHTATLLNDGKVLVTGGDQGSLGQTTETFDPAGSNGNGSFTRQADMTTSRYYHKASLVKDGRVLISGGSSGGPLASMDLYSPSINSQASSISPSTSMTLDRSIHTQTSMPNGHILMAGGSGWTSGTPQTTEWFNPTASIGSEISKGPNMIYARSGHIAVLLKNNSLLIVGGGNAIAEILK